MVNRRFKDYLWENESRISKYTRYSAFGLSKDEYLDKFLTVV